VAATLEKAKTYVFAEPSVRDREVGSSNPLAPTTFQKNYGQQVLSVFRLARCKATVVILKGWEPVLSLGASGRRVAKSTSQPIGHLQFQLGNRNDETTF
jgi:hypothetical protein